MEYLLILRNFAFIRSRNFTVFGFALAVSLTFGVACSSLPSDTVEPSGQSITAVGAEQSSDRGENPKSSTDITVFGAPSDAPSGDGDQPPPDDTYVEPPPDDTYVEPPPDDGTYFEPPPDDGTFVDDGTYVLDPNFDYDLNAYIDFDAQQFADFDPDAVGSFDAYQFVNFDPLAVAGFDADQFANFDPSAMAGFDADQFANFDPAAMAGFGASQVVFFDPAAMAGFGRDQMTGMDPGALAGFDVTQVQNLDPDALHGIGDKVMTFDDFDLDVRKELVDAPALRLGGVGSFDELLKLLADNADSSFPAPDNLEELGWDNSLDDIAGIDFGAFAGSDNSGVDDDALAAALAAFEAAGLGSVTP